MMGQQLPPEIYEKHWIHSREEDTEGIQVYRPSTFNFPLSRGRRGFEIEKSGAFLEYGIGPDDRSNKVEGKWTTAEEPAIIKIDFPGRSIKSYKMKIISCNNESLKIRKLE
jgi:hypothetical protein